MPDDLTLVERKWADITTAFSFRLRLDFRSSRYRYIGHLIQAKYSTPLQTDAREREREQSRMSSFSNSIVELFKDPKQKIPKFPKDLIKVLEQRLTEIAMGQRPECVTTNRPQFRGSN